MTSEQIYFKHVVGASALMAWCRRWTHVPGGVSLTDNIATLGSVAAQRFGIAWPKKKRFAAGPSLLYQSAEAQWMEHINWGRAVIEPAIHNQPAYLTVLTKMVAGDESKFVDIPVFAIRIPLSADNADLWMDIAGNKVEVRRVWQDPEEAEASISTPHTSIALSVSLPGAPLFHPDELAGITPFHELLEKRLRQTGVEADPGYSGSMTMSEIDDPYIKSQQDYRKSLGATDTPG